MNDFDINLFREKTLGVLRYLVRFCEKNNLQYFMACGSALGCVRHKGFIPWDDDIDIYMPRTDYNRLIQMREQMIPDGFAVQYIKDKGYHLPFAKCIDLNTTLWEVKYFQGIWGCFVDIFPLDTTNMGMGNYFKKYLSFQMQCRIYEAKCSKQNLSDVASEFRSGHKGALFRYFLKPLLLFKSREEIANKIIEKQESLNNIEGNKLISITETAPYMFDKRWFESSVMMPFEDLMVRMPVGYHEYLTYFYGNYMKLPPIEEQKLHHRKYYCNLRQRESLEQIKKKLSHKR